MRRLIYISVISLAMAAHAGAQFESGDAAFWRELQKLCGKAFAGTITADTAPNPDFTGKAMTMHVRSCEPDRIRIPFVVGENRSRTWILTRKAGRIELKHDHRHEDGTPDKVTMYGGTTTNAGMATRQFFPADDETVRVVAAPPNNAPTAAANVWWIELVSGEYFTYNLRRLGGDRLFTVRFDLKSPVKAPEEPWGWKRIPGNEPKLDMKESPNPAVYFEIPVVDMERAVKFYTSVFGCVFEKQVIDGNEMALFPFVEKESGISGALAKGKTYKPSKDGTLVYLKSANIDGTLKLVRQSGGKVLYPKTSIGDLGFVAEFEDSEGNRVALHSPVKNPK